MASCVILIGLFCVTKLELLVFINDNTSTSYASVTENELLKFRVCAISVCARCVKVKLNTSIDFCCLKTKKMNRVKRLI